MNFNPWSKGNLDRVYIEGLAGTSGKVYAHVRQGRFEIVAEQKHESDAFLLEQVLAQLRLPQNVSGGQLLEAMKKAGASATRAAARPYTPVAVSQRSGDLAFENIKNPVAVEIEVDFREPEEIDDLLRLAPNTVVTRKHLPLGDYRINGGRVLVERKSTRDFAQSVQKGHLFDQAQRIGFETGVVAVCLLEGDLPDGNPEMSVASISGALTCLSLVQGMSVFNTLDLRHTAYVLAKIAQHERNGLGYELATRKEKPKQLLDAQRYVLEGINGVSPRVAEALLAHFGSIRAIAAADATALQAVDGVGPKTAASLFEVLSGAYTPMAARRSRSATESSAD